MQCKHCAVRIRHFFGPLWHDDGLVFPQYCRTRLDPKGEILPSRLHEPIKKSVQGTEILGTVAECAQKLVGKFTKPGAGDLSPRGSQ